MFRPTDRQMSLIGAKSGLSPGAQQRLEASWAEGFRREVMPELLVAEESFSILYADGGRPNWSVARLLGVCLLQQLQDHSDQQALDALSFDVRWQHALDVAGEDAYLSRRSLVEFRRRLVERDPDGALLRAVFDRVLTAGIQSLNLKTAEQRLDSTMVASNIRARGRLSLARETLRVFIRGLNSDQRQQLPEEVLAWYESRRDWEPLDDKGDLGERERRLHEVGGWVDAALHAFSDDSEVVSSDAYHLLVRLASEHAQPLGLKEAEAIHDDDTDGDGGTGTPPSAPNTDARRRAR
ncbi:MAG: transposase, partial [Myxococcales bacterium]|nr:transposase [Myxococcales bacterium]